MIDPIMLFIVFLFLIILILDRLDRKSESEVGENFVVYHPTTYERKPKLPCTDYNLNFNCANQIEDLDNHYYNVCQTSTLTCHRNPNYVMARSLGRPRTCRRLIGGCD